MTKERKHLIAEEFVAWHDKKHAATGYWPSNLQINNWWLKKLQKVQEAARAEEHRAGYMEAVGKIPDVSIISVPGDGIPTIAGEDFKQQLKDNYQEPV